MQSSHLLKYESGAFVVTITSDIEAGDAESVARSEDMRVVLIAGEFIKRIKRVLGLVERFAQPNMLIITFGKLAAFLRFFDNLYCAMLVFQIIYINGQTIIAVFQGNKERVIENVPIHRHEYFRVWFPDGWKNHVYCWLCHNLPLLDP